MSDQTAQLRLQYGLPPREPTVDLEIDDRDAMDNRAIQVKPETVFNWRASEEEFRAFYDGKEILKVLENGRQIVRVYAPPELEVNVFSTRLPVAINAQYLARLNLRFTVTRGVGNNVWSTFVRAATRFEDVTKIPGVTLTQIAPPRMAPPEVEFLGTDQQLVVDHLRFDQSRVAYQRYSYARSGFEVMGQTLFRAADGRIIDPPVYVSELGAFVLKEPATGEAIISYPVKFRRYRVNYGIGAGLEFKHVQLAWLRGDITQCPMPPVIVLANATAIPRLASIRFSPQVEPRGAYLGSWSFTGYEQAVNPATSNLFTEAQRTTDTVRVFDPDNGEQFIDVQRARSVTLFDAQGRPYTYRFNP